MATSQLWLSMIIPERGCSEDLLVHSMKGRVKRLALLASISLDYISLIQKQAEMDPAARTHLFFGFGNGLVQELKHALNNIEA